MFHDNNGREAQAIPNYQKAIRLGLNRNREAMARAWLASSLFKTGYPQRALKECGAVLKLTKSVGLLKFVAGLETRISKICRPA